MPAARAASSRLIPSSALASASRRLLTRPSRSRRASARSSAGVRPVVIGTATMARLPARYSPAKSWAAPTTGQDFLRPVSQPWTGTFLRPTVYRDTHLRLGDGGEEVRDGRERRGRRGPGGARPPRWRRRARAHTATAHVGAPQAGGRVAAAAG